MHAALNIYIYIYVYIYIYHPALFRGNLISQFLSCRLGHAALPLPEFKVAGLSSTEVSLKRSSIGVERQVPKSKTRIQSDSLVLLGRAGHGPIEKTEL